MTYPPIPPGPNGPWPPPQQPPYQQPYQPPYGYGMPPQGYYPPPKPGGNRPLLIFGAVAVVALLVVVGIVAVVASSDGSDSRTASRSATSSDEEAIRALLEAPSLDSDSDISDALPYFCEADQELLRKIDDLGVASKDIVGQEPDRSTTVGDIEVNGDKATAQIENSAGPGKMYFRKEAGEWKICMSDMPGMPKVR